MEDIKDVNSTGEQVKTFTQDEVNGIVQERLKREREKYKNEQDAAFAEREKAIAAREMRMNALEKLNEHGLPSELVDAINCTDDETMTKSIELLAKNYKSPTDRTPAVRKPSYTPRDGNNAPFDSIRRAMGLE